MEKETTEEKQDEKKSFLDMPIQKRIKLAKTNHGITKEKIQARAHLKVQFYDWLRNVGPWNVSIPLSSEKLGLPVNTLKRWRDDWLNEQGPQSVQRFGVELLTHGKAALQKLASIMVTTKDDKVALVAAKQFLEASRIHTELLERWNWKEVNQDLQTPKEVKLRGDKELYELLTADQRKQLIKYIEDGNTIDTDSEVTIANGNK